MKKILLSILLFIGTLSADLVDDGFYAYNNDEKEKAIILWRAACNVGKFIGCYNLALMYDKGDGVSQNKKKAKELYGKACKEGNKMSCKNYRKLKEQGIS